MDFAVSRNLRTWTSVIGRKSIRHPDEAICSILNLIPTQVTKKPNKVCYSAFL
jgi:hypothetical protein